MSSSAWEERATPAQTSPPNSYRFEQSYAPSEHGSGKKFNDNQGRSCAGYASSPSVARDYSDLGSVKDYGNGVKGYSSNPHSENGSLKDFTDNHYGGGGSNNQGDGQGNARFCGSQIGSHHSSIKDFASDHGSCKIVGDTRGSSDYEYGGHRNGDLASNETHQESDCMINIKDYMRIGMSWLDRRSYHIGEPCAASLDWKHHPTLRQVPPNEHQNYRHAKLEEWLSTAHKRKLKENFGAYVWRASALANSELKHRKKQCWGDEYGDPLDRFVMRLFYGMKLKLERTESVVLAVNEETDILDILREECEELSKSGQLPVNQRNIQYTPLIISEMQERSNNGY